MVRFCSIILFGFVVILHPNVSHARVITVEFNADVTGVSDSCNILEGKIEVGDVINGSYSYDTSMPYSPDRPGYYFFDSPPAGISVQTGGFVFKTDPNNVDLYIHTQNDSLYADGFAVESFIMQSYRNNLILYDDIPYNSITDSAIRIELSNGTIDKAYRLSALLSTALPATSIKLSDWYKAEVIISGFGDINQYFCIKSRLTSATMISDPPKIIYVDDDASGSNDGSSWENAYTFLQDAIADANASDKPVEIRVAQGIYKPDLGAGINIGDREATFNMMNQVELKGGYGGVNDSNPDERNIHINRTILTGDLNGNDLIGFRNRNDNSYHVLSAIDVDESALLEGFIVTAGNADGLPEGETNLSKRRNDHSIRGGGLYIYEGHPIIQRCEFKDNLAYGYGGGTYVYGSCRIINCNLSGNHAQLSGGAVCSGSEVSFGDIFYALGDIFFKGCVIQGNTSISGVDFFGNVRIVFMNCTLADNFINEQYINGANCIMWESEQNKPQSQYLWYSDINNNYLSRGNINTDPLFASPGYWDQNDTPNDPNDNFWVEGDYHLKSQAGRWDPNTQSWMQDNVTSPCIDAGDPNSPIGLEPFPNGGYINMGAYGGTSEASKSYFGKPVCTTIVAGDINGDCKVDILDLEILMQHWLEEH